MAREKFQSLADQVYNYLKDQIINNELEPGTPIYVERLSKEFGLSSTPIREALLKLAGLNLVTIKRNKNITVSEMSREKITDILEMRRLLETFGCRTAVHQVSDEEIIDLELILEKVKSNPEDFNYYKYSDVKLHETITRHIKNSEIKETLKNLSIYSLRIRYYARYYIKGEKQKKASVLKVTDEHLSILEALKKREAILLEKAMERHLLNAEKRTLDALAEKENKIKTGEKV